jgi:hypothetical protein
MPATIETPKSSERFNSLNLAWVRAGMVNESTARFLARVTPENRAVPRDRVISTRSSDTLVWPVGFKAPASWGGAVQRTAARDKKRFL